MPYCRCCHVDNAIFSERKSFNDLPTANIVCDLCSRHQGSDVHDLRKAAAVHREIWAEHERERVENLTASYQIKLAAKDAVITERDQEIESLKQELDERPVQVVEKWHEEGVLQEAHDKARAAYASREHAFRQLCLIHMKHHEVTGERCSCGRSIADCDVVGIIEGYRALLRWERTQEERRDRGLTHALPYEYVKYLGGWQPGDDRSEFEPYPYDSTGT